MLVGGLPGARQKRDSDPQVHFLLLKVAHLAASLVALRHRPRLFGWLIFLAADHACQSTLYGTIPLRLAAALIALANAALAAAPMVTGTACPEAQQVGSACMEESRGPVESLTL